jgi:tetratricopeptide (TPR) repeat protein/O-antigen ligase
MLTKISRYCEGIMEAAWLSALIVVPIYFNIYSSRIFEPDKITILRSLALLILGAWIVKLIVEGGPRWDWIQPGNSIYKFITNFPLLAPVMIMVVLYLISTIFSVAPRTSFWGSYQRLQGTYTTFSYLIIFAAILGNMRRRAQIERLITTAILASMPVALYGILQRFQVDPIPWAGDTSLRIAANMGNSIFVAAYLIMVFPLTVGRIVQSFSSILQDEQAIWSQVARSTIYVFLAAVQVIALYMSGSRGPALGWLAGSFFLFLLLSLHWQKRWLTLGTVGAAMVVGIFLVIFNIEGGPLEGLRTSPAIGRFGQLLNPESNSALVRKYIWEGAAELVKLHAPLEYPDGHKDTFNLLRPLIGYGPESMYVAYNPFYVPDLAIVERRNASPDRSHNETWDALVITGVLGILVYLALFTLVFYYGLKWIGLIGGAKQRTAFLALWLGVGLIGGSVMSLWRGLEYLGVGLPFGMLIGLLVYLTLVAITGKYQMPRTGTESMQSLTLIVIIAAIVSHFIEINFGIAIVSTRLYFWTYAALLVVEGYILPRSGGSNVVPVDNDQLLKVPVGTVRKSSSMSSKKKRRSRGEAPSLNQNWLMVNRDAIIPGLLIAVVLITLGFDFVANSRGLKSAIQIVWASFTRLPKLNDALSYGILMMILTSWLFVGIVFLTEQPKEGMRSWWKGFAIMLGLSLALGILYWFWQADGLASMARHSATTMEEVLTQVGRFEGLLSRFYIALIVLVMTLAFVLPAENPALRETRNPAAIVAAPVMLLLVIGLVFYTNIRVIQADIVFKIADPFARSAQWPVAITIYDRANKLAPNEDYYYLFLGRAYLESAKTLKDGNQRDNLMQQAESDLLKAQMLNPLNTDHTANLARLYSSWAAYATTPEDRQLRAEKSSTYFSRAVALSRNSATLWDEWASLFLFELQQPDEAYSRLKHAEQIDPKYHRTYALLGEYYLRKALADEDAAVKQDHLRQAADNLVAALELPTPGEPTAKFNYAQMLGSAYLQLGQSQGALDAYMQALKNAPTGAETWRIQETLARLYAQAGDPENALLHLQYALNDAPDDQKDRLRAVLKQLQTASP